MAKFLSQLCNTGFTALDEGLYFSSLQKYFPVKFWSPEKTKNYQLENYNYCHETLKVINLLSKEKCLYLLNCIKEIWIVISVTTALEFQRSPCCEREKKKKKMHIFKLDLVIIYMVSWVLAKLLKGNQFSYHIITSNSKLLKILLHLSRSVVVT